MFFKNLALRINMRECNGCRTMEVLRQCERNYNDEERYISKNGEVRKLQGILIQMHHEMLLCQMPPASTRKHKLFHGIGSLILVFQKGDTGLVCF